jgi:RNA polymerase sigma factor (sigma-70 family)
VREGDQAAWAQLVERCTPLLWSVARSFRLSDAEAADVVQLAWLRLVERLDAIREPERIPAWLATTTRHECIATLRRRKREAPAPDEQLDRGAVADPIEVGVLTRERDRALWEAFTTLSERCQRLLRLLGAADDAALDYKAISGALEMPIGSIGPTRARCLERLRMAAQSRGIRMEATA